MEAYGYGSVLAFDNNKMQNDLPAFLSKIKQMAKTYTHAAILRGGCYYHAQTSMWYFPQAHKPNEHGKYLLTSPGWDRIATLGFRCVADR